MSERRSRLELTGMSCANCAGSIEERVGDLAGVSSVTANYATDEGSVTYDPEAVSLAEIFDAVEDAGYGVVRETVTFGITDMSCSNCADSSEEALLDAPGVVDATVNFATDEARVEYNPADVDRSDLYDAVEDAGYSPVRADDGDGDVDSGGESGQSRQDVARNEEITRQKRLTLFGAALSLPLVAMMAV